MVTTVPITIVATNVAPQPSECGKEYRAKVGGENDLLFKAVDNCPGDPMSWYIVDFSTIVGPAAFVGNVLKYTPDRLMLANTTLLSV
jgi:hypothetical protein